MRAEARAVESCHGMTKTTGAPGCGTRSHPRALLSVLLGACALFGGLLFAPQHALADATTASDDFNRADGSLGPNWTDMADGGLAIASDAVTGTAAAGPSGDMWTAGAFGSDQFSQIQLTGTQLTGGQWIGVTVRAQDGGQDGYTGLYFWNYGNPELMLFARSDGNWSQLGGAVPTGPLPGGTVLEVDASGPAISLLENGAQVITATDTSITGGAPGIMAFGTAQAGDWAGGDLGSSPGPGSGPTAAYTVGGAVTGLTGPVVLQDNGGDALTVPASGSFTFATALAQGAAYDVTIATQPAGQTCTITGGSGTMPAAAITTITVTCTTPASGSTASDDFNRADGSLGPNWTDMADGGLAIASDAVTGTAAAGPSGDMWTAGAFGSDQFSQIQLTGTQLTGGQWIGVTVRAQDGGQDGYTGLYFWNYGNPELMLFARSDGNWSQLGGAVPTGPLPGGTVLEVDASGPAISLLENGAQVITATDTSITGGAPGIMAFGTAQAGDWAGGDLGSSPGPGSGPTAAYTVGGAVTGLTGPVVLQDNGGDALTVPASGSFTFATALAQGAAYDVTIATQPAGQTCTITGGSGTMPAAAITTITVTCAGSEPSFQATYESTDSNGIETYDVTSSDDGPDPQEVRILPPTDPAPGVAHNFLFVLPVEAGLGTDFGDGMETMAGLNAQNQYNLTIIEPTFELDPWYANNPDDAAVQYETFMTDDLVPWIEANFSTTGHEQNWLIGFSKSGLGAQDLILKHPDVFTLAASWDFPADMSSYDEYCCDADANYGTNASFQANYELTQAFVDAHKAPFLNSNRIWIGSGVSFVPDVADYDALLTAEGIMHTTEVPEAMPHNWDGGWVPLALAGLYQDSLNLGS
jgi:hypothetical protein